LLREKVGERSGWKRIERETAGKTRDVVACVRKSMDGQRCFRKIVGGGKLGEISTTFETKLTKSA